MGCLRLGVKPVSLLECKLAEFEQKLIEETIASTGGQMSRAAKMLGISRSSIYRHCLKLGISRNQVIAAMGAREMSP